MGLFQHVDIILKAYRSFGGFAWFSYEESFCLPDRSHLDNLVLLLVVPKISVTGKVYALRTMTINANGCIHVSIGTNAPFVQDTTL